MVEDKNTATDSGHSPVAPLRRRDFLSLGSLFALAPWAERIAAALPAQPAAEELAAVQSAVSDPPVQAVGSVGYLEGSDGLRQLKRLPTNLRLSTVIRRGATLTTESRVVPAASLASGDPALAGGAVRLAVHGLYPAAPPRPGTPRAVDLDVLAPMPETETTARFLAWSYRRLPAENLSANLSILVWPDFSHDLALSMRVVPAKSAASPTLRLEITFTLGADAERPRLQRGIYLVGLTPTTWEEPTELPEDPTGLLPHHLSLLLTVEPEGARIGVRG